MITRLQPSSKIESDVLNFLNTIKNMMESNRHEYSSKYMTWEALVLEYGTFFDIADEETVRKHKSLFAYDLKKECYRNATSAIIANVNSDKLTYCEGYAANTVMDGYPFEHAWVIDEEGKVIDPKWDGVAYFGIPFEWEFVLSTIVAKSTYGVMFSLDSPRELILNGFPVGAIKLVNDPKKTAVESQEGLQRSL